MSYENVKNSRARLKNRAVYVLGGKCQICGYDKCQQALEFHHIDPNTKAFGIQENCNRSWETVKAEIKKCALLCANCHREVHSGLINSPQHSPYDETKAEEISNLIEDLKTHKASYCKECGVEVSLPGYETVIFQPIPIFDGVTAIQQADLIPVPENENTDALQRNRPQIFETPAGPL